MKTGKMQQLTKGSIGTLVMVMLIALSAILFNPTAVLANEIVVKIDGTQVAFEGQRPVIDNGRTLVPVRGVFEALGFDVSWNGDTQTATLARTDAVIHITVGSSIFTTNEVSYTLDVPAQIISGRTMIPLRAVLESVGYSLEWDGSTSTISIGGGVPTNSTESKKLPDGIKAYDGFPDLIDFGDFCTLVNKSAIEKYEEKGAVGYVYYVHKRDGDELKQLQTYVYTHVLYLDFEITDTASVSGASRISFNNGSIAVEVIAKDMSTQYLMVVLTIESK